MERSSDRSCRQRLDEDTGQVHSRRAGVFPAISTGTRWSLLLPVEAQDHQLRLGAQGAKMLLDADSKVLVAAAKQMLDSTDEELLYATASEPGRKKPAKTRAKPKKKVTENSESAVAAAVRLRQTPTPCWNSSERVGSAVVCKKKAERKRLGAHQRGGASGSLCCRRRRKTARASRNQNWM